MSTRPSGRLISTTSAHDPSPSAPISTSLKTQATYPPSVRERARKYPTAVAPPISRQSPVRGPKYVVKVGKTPVLEAEAWRKLLKSIPTENVRDLRDRSLIATLTYSFARISAALRMKVEDLRPRGAAFGRSGCTKKAASSIRCRATTRLPKRYTPISAQPVSPTIGKAGCSARLAGTKEARYPRNRWVSPMPGA